MKLIIHGGFFSESSKSDVTKLAKQQSLKNILTKTLTYLGCKTQAFLTMNFRPN